MKLIYLFCGIIVSFFWGLLPVIHKHLLKNISGLSIMFFSSLFYFIAICLFTLYNQKIIMKDFKKMTIYNYIWIFIAAIFCLFVANLLYYYILKKNNSSAISALIYSCPIFTLLIAYFFLKEEIDTYGLLGIFFVILGIIFISLNDNVKEEFNFIR
jgi:drug/metabolite transporter (DMT)-like permease